MLNSNENDKFKIKDMKNLTLQETIIRKLPAKSSTSIAQNDRISWF